MPQLETLLSQIEAVLLVRARDIGDRYDREILKPLGRLIDLGHRLSLELDPGIRPPSPAPGDRPVRRSASLPEGSPEGAVEAEPEALRKTDCKPSGASGGAAASSGTDPEREAGLDGMSAASAILPERVPAVPEAERQPPPAVPEVARPSPAAAPSRPPPGRDLGSLPSPPMKLTRDALCGPARTIARASRPSTGRMTQAEASRWLGKHGAVIFSLGDGYHVDGQDLTTAEMIELAERRLERATRR